MIAAPIIRPLWRGKTPIARTFTFRGHAFPLSECERDHRSFRLVDDPSRRVIGDVSDRCHE